jgi:hypothetical protein
MNKEEALKPKMVILKTGERVHLTEELYARCSNFDDAGMPRDNFAESPHILRDWATYLKHRRYALSLEEKEHKVPDNVTMEMVGETKPEPKEKPVEEPEEAPQEKPKAKKKTSKEKGAKK